MRLEAECQWKQEEKKKLDIQSGHQSFSPSLVTLTNVKATGRQ